MQLLKLLKDKDLKWNGRQDDTENDPSKYSLKMNWILLYADKASPGGQRNLESGRDKKEIFRDSANVTEPDSMAKWYTSQKGHYHSEHIYVTEKIIASLCTHDMETTPRAWSVKALWRVHHNTSWENDHLIRGGTLNGEA